MKHDPGSGTSFHGTSPPRTRLSPFTFRETGPRPATAGDLERLFADVEHALAAIGFFKSHVEEQVMRTVREVAHRAPLDEREARLLRAMALEAAWHASGRPGASGPPPPRYHTNAIVSDPNTPIRRSA